MKQPTHAVNILFLNHYVHTIVWWKEAEFHMFNVLYVNQYLYPPGCMRTSRYSIWIKSSPCSVWIRHCSNRRYWQKRRQKVKLCYGHYIVKFRDYDHLNFRQICFSDNLTLKPFRYYDHHSLQRPLDSKTDQLFKPFDINIGLLVLK